MGVNKEFIEVNLWDGRLAYVKIAYISSIIEDRDGFARIYMNEDISNNYCQTKETYQEVKKKLEEY